MVVSMTGFGRSQKETDRFSVTVEIKTVNHRFCEIQIRMPRQLLKIEDKLKKKLSEHILRGRVEVFVTVTGESVTNRKVHIDWNLLDEYYRSIIAIKEKYELHQQVSLQDLIQREELIGIDEQETDQVDLESLVISAVEEAVIELKAMRRSEGEALLHDILTSLTLLKSRTNQLRELAPIVVTQFKDRVTKRMKELLEGQFDEVRILSEVAIFADKADIHEELTRLESHLHQFNQILQLSEPVGRKCDFLLQEMNREVNTIGSKANDSQIANEVVEMKSLMEKIKEQIQNIE
jgi:uncharacterized protein (TIGR00255 family)